MASSVVRWILRRAFARPTAWLVWTFSISAGPCLALLSPVGLTTRSLEPAVWVGELTFLGALFGACFALSALGEASGLLRRAAGRQRLALRGLAIGTGVATFALPPLVSAFIFLSTSGHAPLAVPWGPALLSALHVAALALVLAGLPIPPLLRSLALLFLAWFIPGGLQPQSYLEAGLLTLVDASHAATGLEPLSSWGARFAVWAPIMVLAGAAALLRSPRLDR